MSLVLVTSIPATPVDDRTSCAPMGRFGLLVGWSRAEKINLYVHFTLRLYYTDEFSFCR